jgi:hypothetical protein
MNINSSSTTLATLSRLPRPIQVPNQGKLKSTELEYLMKVRIRNVCIFYNKITSGTFDSSLDFVTNNFHSCKCRQLSTWSS